MRKATGPDQGDQTLRCYQLGLNARAAHQLTIHAHRPGEGRPLDHVQPDLAGLIPNQNVFHTRCALEYLGRHRQAHEVEREPVALLYRLDSNGEHGWIVISLPEWGQFRMPWGRCTGENKAPTG
ncbi:hypothetical protein FBZ92_14028 [Nitrospirillum viridazoti]|uniref:Uncharacterized protein n=1 Tax=Nitrospirillum amazonense TaxID=28077 RepID=A0A560HPD5_9PROT|nr:hypothetical protein FBZ92_14028 [Nitrospirillum amazonense]